MSKILENEIFEAALLRISKGDLSPLELIYERFGKLLFSIAFPYLKIDKRQKMFYRKHSLK